MRTALLILISVWLLAPAPAQQGSVAVRAGQLITGDGSVIENGTVVIVNGKIQSVGGPELEIPFDVLLKEFPDGVAFAGFSEAHSSRGVDRANENVPVAPFLNVKDSIDPVNFYFEDELRGGTVAIGVIPGNDCVIGGRGRVVAPAGVTVEEMTLAEDMGMKIAISPKRRWSRSAQLAELREAFRSLDDALRVLGQKLLDAEDSRSELEGIGQEVAGEPRRAGAYLRFGEDFPGKGLIRAEDLDDIQRGLVDIRNGDVRLWLACLEPTDVHRGRAWAEEHGLLDQVVMVVSSATWKVADMLADLGRPVVLDASSGLWHVERDPVSWEEVRTFAPKAFHDAGVSFSITSNEGRLGPDRLGYQAATCVREGVPREAALAAVTSRPAEAWGAADRLGKLAPGYEGNVVVLDGDPLDIGSTVLKVWVQGREVYDRAKDARLERLLEGETK